MARKPRRKIKQAILEGGVIEGPGPNGFIIRTDLSLVPTQRSDKLQIIPKKTRPAMPGKYRRAFIKAFEDTRGNISKSCRIAKISRQTVYRWLESSRPVNEKFRQHLRNTRPIEAKKDFYEECLEDIALGVSEGSAAASIFALKSLAGDRGFKDRPDRDVAQEVTDAIKIEINKLRQQIATVAERFGTDYGSELRGFLTEYGMTLNPAIRTELASELEQ